jgi:hypothetical protein
MPAFKTIDKYLGAKITSPAKAHKSILIVVRGPRAETAAWSYARLLSDRKLPIMVISGEALCDCHRSNGAPLLLIAYYAGSNPYVAKAMLSDADMGIITDAQTAVVEYCGPRAAAVVSPRIMGI